MGLFDRLFKKSAPAIEGEEPPAQLPQRNEACWCGSGEKYKKCHMDKDRLYLEQKNKLEAQNDCGPVFG